MTEVNEAAAPKIKRVIKRPSAAPKAAKAAPKPKGAEKPVKAEAPQPKPKAVKPEKPSVPAYSFENGYEGPSNGINARNSRTPIDLSRFGQFKDAVLTDRDQKNVEALRREFGSKEFERRNLDAGVLRRLGERGCLSYVSGANNAPDAKFKLTAKGLGKPDARKAA